MNERNQVLIFLLDACEIKNQTIAALQQKVGELEKKLISIDPQIVSVLSVDSPKVE